MSSDSDTSRKGSETAVNPQVLEQPEALDFFQGVYLIEVAALAQRRGRGERRLGRASSPSREPLTLETDQSLAFPGQSIRQIQLDPQSSGSSGKTRPRMRVSFMGLFGHAGVLPLHMRQSVVRLVRDRASALMDFLDIFSHRFVSYFYRAWLKSSFAHSAQLDTHAEVTPTALNPVYAAGGFISGQLRARSGLPDSVFLKYAGLLSSRTRPPSGLASMVADFVDAPASVSEFTGGWQMVSSRDLTRLGADELAAPELVQLGGAAMLGQSVFRPASRFRVCVGPLAWDRFKEVLPSGGMLRTLDAMIRLYAGTVVEYDMQFSVWGAEVPERTLGQDGIEGYQLGWTSWLGQVSEDKELDDPLFVLGTG